MLSSGLSLFRRRNGMVRNSSITHHPNCAYLEVECGSKGVIAMETSIMLTREPDRKRARKSDAGHI